jgi:hypothetical protein
VSKTRRIEFTRSVLATCKNTAKLKDRLLSRFAVIQMEKYTREEFIETTVQKLKTHPLARYIAEQVYETKGADANIRDCVRIAAVSTTHQDVLRVLRILK